MPELCIAIHKIHCMVLINSTSQHKKKKNIPSYMVTQFYILTTGWFSKRNQKSSTKIQVLTKISGKFTTVRHWETYQLLQYILCCVLRFDTRVMKMMRFFLLFYLFIFIVAIYFLKHCFKKFILKL